MNEIAYVPAEYIPLEWINVYKLLQPAVERSGGRWTMDSLLLALCVGDQVLWVSRDENKVIASALTTQIVNYPNKRILAFQFLGGKGFDKWSDNMLSRMEQYAKDTDCDGMEAVGRFGFWPFFKKRGYERAYCTYQKMFQRKDS
jgi:hypothetical protein